MENTLQQNLRLYPLMRIAANGHAWITVFFLYMSQHLSLDDVIRLSSIYYLTVFLLEVPSGYFSDRLGRRRTLLLAALAFVLAHACFLVGGSFALFAAGQICLAAGFALQSGTDSALLFDSLKSLDRDAEYAQREADAEYRGLLAIALATLAGGLLGAIDLRLAYAYSLASALLMLLVTLRFVEPPAEAADPTLREDFLAVVWRCLLRLRDPVLAWLFGLGILLYALAHFVFEFYQPYIRLLDLFEFDPARSAPLLSGLVISVSMFGGALGARLSIRWASALGLVGLLGVASVIQLGIVAAMAAVISPAVLALVFLRNFPMALAHAPVRAAIAPRIDRRQRATYLSLQGLADRLVFALLLLGIAGGLEAGAPIDQQTLLGILTTMFWIGAVATGAMFLFARPIARRLHRVEP